MVQAMLQLTPKNDVTSYIRAVEGASRPCPGRRPFCRRTTGAAPACMRC
ncbi:hypothetical protein ACFQU7_22655 [Pseudoroseomonas wenyumeiae]